MFYTAIEEILFIFRNDSFTKYIYCRFGLSITTKHKKMNNNNYQANGKSYKIGGINIPVVVSVKSFDYYSDFYKKRIAICKAHNAPDAVAHWQKRYDKHIASK